MVHLLIKHTISRLCIWHNRIMILLDRNCMISTKKREKKILFFYPTVIVATQAHWSQLTGSPFCCKKWTAHKSRWDWMTLFYPVSINKRAPHRNAYLFSLTRLLCYAFMYFSFFSLLFQQSTKKAENCSFYSVVKSIKLAKSTWSVNFLPNLILKNTKNMCVVCFVVVHCFQQ